MPFAAFHKILIGSRMIFEFMSKLRDWHASWKTELWKHKYLIIVSLFIFWLAIRVNLLASNYVDRIPVNSVSDVILDHIPSLDLDLVFGYGLILVVIAIIVYLLAYRIQDFHKVTLQFSLLIFARSCFITLTHLGQPAAARIVTDLPAAYQLLNYHNDLFFSGHTAIPFMAYLLFKEDKISAFFLVMTVVLSATVLLMHVHYSIDVFSAFFITYGVYVFGEWFCREVYH